MRALENRIPPPLVGILAGLLAWLASAGFGATTLPAQVRLATALALVVLGLAVALAGVRAVRRASTTLNPLKPETATALVTSGIYRYTRNPMYLGMCTWLLALAAWLGTPAALLGPALFVAYISRFQIVPEERALAQLFGPQFAAYKARVRRWV